MIRTSEACAEHREDVGAVIDLAAERVRRRAGTAERTAYFAAGALALFSAGRLPFNQVLAALVAPFNA